MPVRYLGKKRESLHRVSEDYKSYIRRFLDLEGYSQITDSYTDGDLPDMVFVNPDIDVDRLTYVEAKATQISPSDRQFSLEILKYLSIWLRKNSRDRFGLMIFAKEVINQKEFDRIFGSTSSQRKIDDFVKKYLNGLNEDMIEIITSASLREIISFFSQVDIIVADESYLRSALEDKQKKSGLSIEAYAEKLVRMTKRHKLPIQRKTSIVSNLVHVSLPPTLYSVKVKYEQRGRVFSTYEGIQLPPFYLSPNSKTLYTFVNLLEFNAFEEISTSKPIQRHFEHDSSFATALINDHMRRILWCKGLRRVSKQNAYYFPITPNEDGIFNELFRNSTRGDKSVTKPEYKKNEPEILNFIFHHSAFIAAKRYFNQIFIEILPNREYTSDGVTVYTGDKKSAIDRKFNSPLFNRSSNKLSEVRFWHKFLVDQDNYERDIENWFSEFQFGKLFEMPFSWVPKTVEPNQAVLGEYVE